MPVKVSWLAQVLAEYQKYGEGVATIENGRLVIRDENGAVAIDLAAGTYLQVYGGATDSYARLMAELDRSQEGGSDAAR